MRRIFTLLALSFVAVASPLAAQTGSSTPEGAVPTAAQPVDRGTEAATEPSGLPLRATPPPTMRAYWHVFAAFAIAWALLFGYALFLGRRFGRLERELRRLA
jgi:CcmD family protein